MDIHVEVCNHVRGFMCISDMEAAVEEATLEKEKELQQVLLVYVLKRHQTGF